jgi:cell division protein FtsB
VTWISGLSIFGTLLAIALYIWYNIKKSAASDQEVASLNNSEKIKDAEIERLNQERAIAEANERAKEKQIGFDIDKAGDTKRAGDWLSHAARGEDDTN